MRPYFSLTVCILFGLTVAARQPYGTSAHHGYINYENQLEPAKDIFQKWSEVITIEVDFVYYQGRFVSSHDYSEANIRLGSSLEEWIKFIVNHDKTMWIDVKDTTWSVISNRFSSFDVNKFYETLDNISTRIPSVSQHILISCQYTNTYNRLVARNLGTGYTLIHDMPQDFAYMLHDILPLSTIKTYVQRSILSKLEGVEGVVCLDRSFFSTTEELMQFISKLASRNVIVYSFKLNESIPVVPGKHIIAQYDYYK